MRNHCAIKFIVIIVKVRIAPSLFVVKPTFRREIATAPRRQEQFNAFKRFKSFIVQGVENYGHACDSRRQLSPGNKKNSPFDRAQNKRG
jgi:hypothetical protein